MFQLWDALRRGFSIERFIESRKNFYPGPEAKIKKSDDLHFAAALLRIHIYFWKKNWKDERNLLHERAMNPFRCRISESAHFSYFP